MAAAPGRLRVRRRRVAGGCAGRAPRRARWRTVRLGAAATVRRSRAGARSRQRFDQESLDEISVEVDNAFAAATGEALAVAEERCGASPGSRRSFGPAQLPDLAVDGAAAPRARWSWRAGAARAEDEAVRQRVVRRADALGWFLTANGSAARSWSTPPTGRASPRGSRPRSAAAVVSSLAPAGLETVRRRVRSGPTRAGAGARLLAACSSPPGRPSCWPAVARAGRRSRGAVRGGASVAAALAAATGAAAAAFALVPGGRRAAGRRAGRGVRPPSSCCSRPPGGSRPRHRRSASAGARWSPPSSRSASCVVGSCGPPAARRDPAVGRVAAAFSSACGPISTSRWCCGSCAG